MKKLLNDFLGSERWERDLEKAPSIKQVDIAYITESQILREWALSTGGYTTLYDNYKNDPRVMIIRDVSEKKVSTT